MTFNELNKENQERAKAIKSNIKKKEKELEQVETNYALCNDARKQAICDKVIKRLDEEIRDLNNEFDKVNTGILNLDKYLDFAFKMRNNLFEMWQLQGLEGKRRLQNLVFPEGFIYDKNKADIEPIRVNEFFLLNYSFSNGNSNKNQRTSCENHSSSLRVLEAGLEPAQPQWPRDFKSLVSTDSTIRASL